MNKKIIIVAIIILLLVVITAFFFPPKKVIKNEVLPVNNITNSIEQPSQPIVENIQPLEELTPAEKEKLKEENLKNELQIKVRNFVERYGSYSTDSHFSNLLDLKDEMSNNFWLKTASYIDSQGKIVAKEFYGISTKVLNISEKNFSADKVSYLMATQRQETKGKSEQVFYQKADIEIIKVNNQWQINNFKWQPESK